MNFVKNSSNVTACIIALLFGTVGTLAYSPFNYWLIAFLSAGSLIWSATLKQRKTALWATFAWSIGYFCVGINWVHISMIQFGGVPVIVSYLAVFLLACYLAIYNLLFTYISHRFHLQNPFILGALFTFTEYLREVVFTGFPWLQFGYSQIDSPFWGIAPILGVEGLTFFVIVVSAYLVKFIKWTLTHQKGAEKIVWVKVHSIIFAVTLLLTFTTQFLEFVQKDEQKQPLVISLVQGNIEQKMKWDPQHFNHTVQTYVELIKPLLGKSDLIVLPESAIPALEEQIQPLLMDFQRAAETKNSEIIIGTLYQNPRQELFNSAVLLGNPAQPYIGTETNRYNKHHLVPFGEYVPFGSVLDWMREVFVLPINLSQGDFVQQPLFAKNQKFNLAICYEVIFGRQVQQNQLAQNADYLLTITNDAWFGSSIGPHQHFQMARMRALELGKPLIRAANTGITAVVDASGQISAQIPQFREGVLTAQIQPTMGQTPYGQFGRWLLYSLCFVLIGFALYQNSLKKSN